MHSMSQRKMDEQEPEIQHFLDDSSSAESDIGNSPYTSYLVILFN